VYKHAGHTHRRIVERLKLPAGQVDVVRLKANTLWREQKLKNKLVSTKLYAPIINNNESIGYALFTPHADNLILKTFYSKTMKPKGMSIGSIKLGAKKNEMPLKYYQQRVIDRILDPKQPGLVVAHGTGTGKTLSSVGAYDALGMPTNVVVPAALKGNYIKEMNKWMGGVPRNVNITSQQMLARGGELKNPSNSLLIVDEAHRARDENSQLLQQLKAMNSKKRLLLTATPMFNHPSDISALVNLAAGKTMLPEDRNEFNKQYVENKEIEAPILQRLFGVKPGIAPMLKNQGKLKSILKKYVDYHQNEQAEGFPSSKEQIVKVPMGENQMNVYKTIMGQAPWWMRWKVKAGLPPGKGELDTMRAFLGGARQISNTDRSFIKNLKREEATKIQSAFKFLKTKMDVDPSYKGVVYSNYLQSGLAPYRDLLTKNNIPYGEFSGDVPEAQRNEMVKQYNANKLKALLISSAGAEGLDLKGTRLVQILEPHFNEEKEKQITGRAIRYGSHAGMPYSQRNVLIQRYLAQPKAGWLDRLLGKSEIKGTDEYIRSMALQKTMLNRQLQQLMQQNNVGTKAY